MSIDLNKDMKSWLSMLNDNLKWSIALAIRIIVLLTILISFILLLKLIGVISLIKNDTTNDIKIKHKDTKIISQPDKKDNTKDLNRISGIQKMLRDRLKKGDNNETK